MLLACFQLSWTHMLPCLQELEEWDAVEQQRLALEQHSIRAMQRKQV